MRNNSGGFGLSSGDAWLLCVAELVSRLLSFAGVVRIVVRSLTCLSQVGGPHGSY